MGLFRLDFIDHTSEINASAADVFSFFKEIEQWPDWASAIKRGYRKSGGEWGVGFKIGFVADFAPFPVETKVLEYAEGERIEWGMQTPVGKIVHCFEFESVDEKRCRVRQTEYAEGIFAILTRPLKGKIGRFDKSLALDLEAAFSK